ncbi:MAG: putative methyltransferase [Betaproteobacteria bacterium ADurb.Bin341]|jgi:adenine-specific DNA-methyltransferase|nr:MAG: putative methyltransferase [Betaproteobacteria bacterium ADurb.Bin341]
MSTTDTHPLDAVSTPDLNAERLAALKRLFPDLFSNEGRLNVDELKKVVDPALVTESERYDFRWYGKTASKREAFTPSRATLIYDPARSVNPDKAGGNVIIEGENLEVLKLLNCAYRERIKCIYIDPPYNTGKDFVYSDRFAEGQKPYWEQTGVTENGVKVDSNSDSDGRFHSNWLTMMHSRLLAARYLLARDGIILISISDHELQSLMRLLHEVFGEENFMGLLIWKSRSFPDSRAKTGLSVDHEYIAVYGRSEESTFRGFERDESKFSNPDNDPRGPWMSRSILGLATKEQRPNLHYPIVDPKTQNSYEPPANTGWRYNKDRMDRLIEQGCILFPKTTDGRPREKKFRADIQNDYVAFPSIIDDVFTSDGTREIRELFTDEVFDFSKPSELIANLLRQTTVSKDIILDFFGGSGTTAQAVMGLNKADGGNRQFILVQLPELTAENSPAYKSGYKRISDITVERAKRVIMKIQKDAENLLPGDAQRQFADSLGFKVYTLAKSRFPRVEFVPDPEKTEDENVEALKRYIEEKESSFHIQLDKEPVRDEVLLKQGFMLDYTLTPQPEFTKNEVVLVRDANKESLLCLDNQIAPETVDYFQTHKDRFFICLELALDTTKKWNLKNHLKDKLKAI